MSFGKEQPRHTFRFSAYSWWRFFAKRCSPSAFWNRSPQGTAVTEADSRHPKTSWKSFWPLPLLPGQCKDCRLYLQSIREDQSEPYMFRFSFFSERPIWHFRWCFRSRIAPWHCKTQWKFRFLPSENQGSVLQTLLQPQSPSISEPKSDCLPCYAQNGLWIL